MTLSFLIGVEVYFNLEWDIFIDFRLKTYNLYLWVISLLRVWSENESLKIVVKNLLYGVGFGFMQIEMIDVVCVCVLGGEWVWQLYLSWI